jgi:hypothetical protein
VLYLPIKKAWIISSAARRVYFVCALAALSLFGGVMGSGAALGASGVHTFEGFPTIGLMLRLLLWPGILGTALLSIAMWYFWFGFDKSGWLKKAIWFLPLYFLLAIGPAFYYFFVYRRNDQVSSST